MIMIQLRSFSFFTLVFFISLSAHAQKFKKDSATKFNHFLEIGVGANYNAIRDEGTSPLTYKGFIPGIHFQYLFHNNRFLGCIDENFSIGNLNTRNFPADKNRAVAYNNDLSFDALYLLKKRGKFAVFGGGKLGTMANIRSNDKFNNASLNYEFMIDLSPSVLMEYQTSWNAAKVNLGILTMNRRDRNIKLQYGISLPVVATILRPGFVTINDFVDDNSLAIEMKDTRLVTVSRLLMVRSRFNFYYILHNRNMLKFNYNFTFFNYNRRFNPVKSINSAFFVSIVFRFNNNN